MEEKAFDEKQAMEVIRTMILQSQKQYGRGAYHFIVWGWFIVVAALVHYANISLSWGISAAYIWFPAIGLPLLVAIVQGLKSGSKQKTTSFVAYCLSGLWASSMGISIVMVLLGLTYGWVQVYPAFIAFFAWGTCTTGIILKFKPLIIGGVAAFLLAVSAVFVSSAEILLIFALAITITYIVPGYLLKRQEK